ncbi:MAG: hypothetical protein HYY62_02965 [Deltaproteobacteria bacterium]|nr:hypothetical protein [Deltaproteobacteria bacterium]
MNLKRETWALICISCAAAFLLGGYEFLRSSTNTLFQAAYGTQNLPLITALMPIGLIFVLYLYGWLLSRLGARRTLFFTSLASGVVIAACYFEIRTGSKIATGVAYIFREAYIVLLIEQYWSFLNSTFGEAYARKLNGPVAGIASIGSVSGGLLLSYLAEPLGTAAMLLFAAGAVIPAALFSEFAYQKCGEPKPTLQEKEGKQGQLGIKVLSHSPLLILLLTLVMASQIVSTVLSLSFQTMLHAEMTNLDQQTAFSGQFFALLNGVSAFFQFVAAPLLLTYVSLKWIHAIIPVIHIAAATALLIHPSLKTAGFAYLIFKALDYSIFRAAKEILYIPLSFDARYRAKELIDVFGYRFSKGGTSLILTILQKIGIVIMPIYSWAALGAACLWFMLILPLIRHLPTKKT